MITAMVKMGFTEHSQPGLTTDRIMKLVNYNLFMILQKSDYFLTAFYCIIDSDKGILEFTNAGHEGAFLLKNNQNQDNLIPLRTRSTYIGVLKDLKFDKKQKDLNKGDKIILYTDGITEAKNTREEFFGRKRFEKIILDNKDLPAKELVETIMEEVERFSGERKQDDDRTILIIDILNEEGKMGVDIDYASTKVEKKF